MIRRTYARRKLAQWDHDVHSDKPLSVVVYGDSWTTDVSSTASTPWATQLSADLTARNPDFSFFNEGVGGWTSGSGVTNIANVTGHNPDYCVMSFGINDWGHGATNNATTATYKSNMQSMIDTLQGAGCQVVLWVTGPEFTIEEKYGSGVWVDDSAAPEHYPDYVTALRAVAADNDLLLIDVRQQFIDYWLHGVDIAAWGYGDGVHFGQTGHDLIYRVFKSVLIPSRRIAA